MTLLNIVLSSGSVRTRVRTPQ